MDKSEQYISRVSKLPPAPTVATELLKLFGDPDCDIDRVVELISHDPSLTVEVLRRCNSAFLSGAQPASDMFEAVTRLGFYEVYTVVVALVGTRTLSLGTAGSGLDMGNFWRHSVATAVAGETLARRIQQTEAVAFTAGLLHDIGRLILAMVEGSRYAALLKPTRGFGPDLVEAEEAVFGVSHAGIGARLLARWDLPANVAAAVLHHHGSPGAIKPFEQLAATVHLANDLAHHLFDQTPDAPDLPPYSLEAMTSLQLTADDIPELLQQTQAGMQRVQGLLQLTA